MGKSKNVGSMTGLQLFRYTEASKVADGDSVACCGPLPRGIRAVFTRTSPFLAAFFTGLHMATFLPVFKPDL